jgi:hypothetical protein
MGFIQKIVVFERRSRSDSRQTVPMAIGYRLTSLVSLAVFEKTKNLKLNNCQLV